MLILLVAAAVIAAGCGESYVMPPTDTRAASTATMTGRLTRPGPVTQNDIKEIIDHEIGTAGEMGMPIIRNISITPAAGGNSVTIDINRTDCPMIGMHMVCMPTQTPMIAADATRKVMSVVFEYQDVSQVQINLYSDLQNDIDMPMTGGAQMDMVPVIKTMINRETANKMDWTAYSEDNAARMATNYWMDPAAMSKSVGAGQAAGSGSTSGSTTGSGGSSGGTGGGSMPGMPGM